MHPTVLCEALSCVLLSRDHCSFLSSNPHFSMLPPQHVLSLLPCLSQHLVSSHALSSFPLSSHLNTYMSQYPILPHPTPLCSSYLHLPAFSLIAGNILSTPTPNPTPTLIPVKISDYDRLKLRIIIVDSTSREVCVWMSL